MEHMNPYRNATFEYVPESMQDMLNVDTDFRSAWMDQMIHLATKCLFFRGFAKNSFVKVLHDLCTHPISYPNDAKEFVEDFLHRFDPIHSGYDQVWEQYNVYIIDDLTYDRRNDFITHVNGLLGEFRRYLTSIISMLSHTISSTNDLPSMVRRMSHPSNKVLMSCLPLRMISQHKPYSKCYRLR